MRGCTRHSGPWRELGGSHMTGSPGEALFVMRPDCFLGSLGAEQPVFLRTMGADYYYTRGKNSSHTATPPKTCLPPVMSDIGKL